MRYIAWFVDTLSLLVQKIIPVKKNRVLFTSFSGHYSDNPKYISQELHTLCPGAEIVWCVKKQYMPLLPEYVKAVDIDDRRAMWWHVATARAIVDNVYGNKETYCTSTSTVRRVEFKLRSWLKKKKGQYVFTTWHGTPIKCMGRDQINSNIIDFSCPNTTMILGNRFTLDIMKHLTFNKVPMKLIGTPRNDLIFCNEEKASEIKKALGLPEEKKIVLFAPTFRSDPGGLEETNIQRSGLNQLNELDIDLLFKNLTEIFGGEWVMVCRFHYHVEKMVDWEGLEKQYFGRIINGNLNDDMAEYMACADVLITDASSSMFDFCLTGRACFLYFPDLEYYATSERGFYMPIEDLPFPVAVTSSKLMQNIINFDAQSYSVAVALLMKRFGYVDDDKSALRVAQCILEEADIHA